MRVTCGTSAAAAGLGYSLLSEVARNKPTLVSKPWRSQLHYVRYTCKVGLLTST